MNLSFVRCTLLLVFVALWCANGVLAQSKPSSMYLGYFAPYGIQIGAKVGTSFEVKQWDASKSSRSFSLSVRPHVGYFSFPDVQHNFLVNTEVVLRTRKSAKRFAPLASLGLGYILGRQRTDGTVDLGTGKRTFNVDTLHQLAPTIGLGFDVLPKKRLGFFLHAFYGPSLISQRANAAFFGLELGVLFNLSN